jgi:hypothetical protein
MQIRGWLLFVLLATLSVVAAGKERTWTSADGRTMRAEFVRELDGDVTFLVAGKLTTIPLGRLSERDQGIVRDLAAGREVPDDPSPASPEPGADDPFRSPAADRQAAANERPPSLIKRPISPTTRVWTDNLGRKKTAKVVRIFDGGVVLSRAGGPVTIPFFDLVEADQQYVREVLASRDEEELIPDRPPATVDGAGGSAAMPAPARSATPPFARSAPGSTVPMTFPPAGYVPPGATGDAGAGSAPPPMNYGSGGYSGSAGYPGETDIGGSSNFFAEQERRADAAANAVQQQADQMMRAQDERRNRMMQPAVPTTQRVPVCSACRATLTEAETHVWLISNSSAPSR